jgi:hypothetical protein
MPLLVTERIPNAPAEYNKQHMSTLVRILTMVFRKLDTDAFRVGDYDTPANASVTGTRGDVKYDANYIYICTDTDTWKRAALSTF